MKRRPFLSLTLSCLSQVTTFAGTSRRRKEGEGEGAAFTVDQAKELRDRAERKSIHKYLKPESPQATARQNGTKVIPMEVED